MTKDEEARIMKHFLDKVKGKKIRLKIFADGEYFIPDGEYIDDHRPLFQQCIRGLSHRSIGGSEFSDHNNIYVPFYGGFAGENDGTWICEWEFYKEE